MVDGMQSNNNVNELTDGKNNFVLSYESLKLFNDIYPVCLSCCIEHKLNSKDKCIDIK